MQRWTITKQKLSMKTIVESTHLHFSKHCENVALKLLLSHHTVNIRFRFQKRALTQNATCS